MKAAGTYRIRIAGQLSQHWAPWFEGLTIQQEANGETTLTGELVDQAALHGVLIRIRDLNLPLIAVERLDDSSRPSDTPRRES